MKRVHLFEFEDQPWFPDVIRRGITDYLDFAATFIDLYKPVMPLLIKGIEKSGTNNIIDMCSGAGGGILKLQRHLNREKENVKIILTDKYPNLDAFRKTSKDSEGKIGFIPHSVDALSIPGSLKGLRTQFVSFHHFKPESAKRILESAVEAKAPVAIFEATERTLFNFLAMLLTPLVVMLAVPFIRPFSFSRLFFSYIIPAIPLFTMWDGLVSVLRTYSMQELNEMTAGIRSKDFTWETGRIKAKGKPAVIYLLGYPQTTEPARVAA